MVESSSSSLVVAAEAATDGSTQIPMLHPPQASPSARSRDKLARVEMKEEEEEDDFMVEENVDP